MQYIRSFLLTYNNIWEMNALLYWRRKILNTRIFKQVAQRSVAHDARTTRARVAHTNITHTAGGRRRSSCIDPARTYNNFTALPHMCAHYMYTYMICVHDVQNK